MSDCEQIEEVLSVARELQAEVRGMLSRLEQQRVDWPGRFRAAADAAEKAAYRTTARRLRLIADSMSEYPPHVVEAIRRALNGEQP